MPDIRRTKSGLVLAGRYHLEHLIARGGMAQVWRAEDDVLGRAVAVKVLLAHLAADESFLARFRREAIAAARLSHANIVSTYDTGVDDGLAYIVMELVEGETLRDALAGPSRPTRSRLVEIAVEVAEALQYAHRCGVVHRDVKPANILLCADGRVKVADFGIAKAALAEDGFEQDLTQTGAILGTAKYLSPEQVDGRSSDGRSDVYALGVVLYEMLCGRPPFTGETDMAVGAQHLSVEPRRPRLLQPDLSPDLEAVVLRALAKAPDQRYPSAGVMGHALRSLPRGTPAVAVPLPDETTPAQGIPVLAPSPPRRWTVPTPSLPVGRSWLAAGGAAALVVVVAIVVAVASLDGSPERPSRERARDGSGPPSAVRIAGVQSFDPDGNGAEHDAELANLTDGNATTTWGTEQYASPQFGNLKPGVGLVIRLDGTTKLTRLTVASPSRGWSAEVATANSSPSDRAAWGQAVDRGTASGGETTFDLGGRSATHLLLWITDLGGQNAMEIGELEAT